MFLGKLSPWMQFLGYMVKYLKGKKGNNSMPKLKLMVATYINCGKNVVWEFLTIENHWPPFSVLQLPRTKIPVDRLENTIFSLPTMQQLSSRQQKYDALHSIRLGSSLRFETDRHWHIELRKTSRIPISTWLLSTQTYFLFSTLRRSQIYDLPGEWFHILKVCVSNQGLIG